MPHDIAVTPLILPKVQWEIFISSSFHGLGRSVTASLDKNKIPIDKGASFIQALGEFKSSNSSPSLTLQEPGALLQHLTYGFEISAPRSIVFELLEISGLNVLTTKTLIKTQLLAIVSGNLEQWRAAIINITNDQVSTSLRQLFNIFILYFEKEGFFDLWHRYKKLSLPDKTFVLKEK